MLAASGVLFPVASLCRVVLSLLLSGEVHEPRPIPQVVDDRQPATTTQFSGRGLLSGEVHVVLGPLATARFKAVSTLLLHERVRHATLLGASSLLVFGECHSAPSL